jgi:hypothetical protein
MILRCFFFFGFPNRCCGSWTVCIVGSTGSYIEGASYNRMDLPSLDKQLAK